MKNSPSNAPLDNPALAKLHLMSEEEILATTQTQTTAKPKEDPAALLKATANWQLDSVQASEKKVYVRKTTCPKCHTNQPETEQDVCIQCGVAMRKYAEQLQKQLALEAGEIEEDLETESEDDIPETLKERLQEKITQWFGGGVSEEIKLAEQAGLLKDQKQTRRKKTFAKTSTPKPAIEQKQGIIRYETVTDEPKSGMIDQLKAKAGGLLASKEATEAEAPPTPEATKPALKPQPTPELKQGITRYEAVTETADTAEKPGLLGKLLKRPAASTTESPTQAVATPAKAVAAPTEPKTSWLKEAKQKLGLTKKTKTKQTHKTHHAPAAVKADETKTAKPSTTPPKSTAKPIIPNPTDPQQELALMVGKNVTYYLKVFNEFQVIDEIGEEIDEFSASWNWPAFCVPFIWFLYRKQYLLSVLALGSMGLPVIANIAWGLSANYLYYRSLKRQIAAIKAVTLKGKIGHALHQSGGVHQGVAVLSGGVAILLVIGALGYGILTAWQ